MDLSDEEKLRLAAMLGTQADAPDHEQRIDTLRQLAFEEYVDWLLARKRFESVSALDHKRILEVFSRIRVEAPSVETLSNDFGISESRAVSMLSRMRYGSARIIRQLQYAAAGTEIQEQRQNVAAEDGLLFLWLRRETARIVEEANTAIMRDTTARQANGKYEGAELARKSEPGRYDEQWSASPKMWDHIVAWIGEHA